MKPRCTGVAFARIISPMQRLPHLLCLTLVALSASPNGARAERIDATPGEDIESIIAGMAPGDELVLAGGLYETTERFSINIAGTESQPIIIRAADGETPHIMRPNASQNIIAAELCSQRRHEPAFILLASRA